MKRTLKISFTIQIVALVLTIVLGPKLRAEKDVSLCLMLCTGGFEKHETTVSYCYRDQPGEDLNEGPVRTCLSGEEFCNPTHCKTEIPGCWTQANIICD